MPTLLNGNNTFIVQIGTSSPGDRVEPLQPKRHEEEVPIFASHRVSKTVSRQRPAERERMAVLGTIKLFRQYAAGRTHVAIL